MAVKTKQIKPDVILEIEKELGVEIERHYSFPRARSRHNCFWVNFEGDIEGLTITNTGMSNLDLLKDIRSLTSLYLNNNEIMDISGISGLINLKYLYLRDNMLEYVASLEGLLSLRCLDLSHNHITNKDDLPDFFKLNKLEVLYIHKNPVWKDTVLENAVYDTNQLDIVKDFIGSVKKNVVLPKKILILGNHATGKTALREYYISGEVPAKTESTHVLDIVPHYVEDKKCPDAIFYDFGGQDFYHGIYRMFFSREAIYILLYRDGQSAGVKTDSSGIENRNFALEYWLEQKKYFESKRMYEESNEERKDPLLLIRTYADKQLARKGIGLDFDKYGMQEVFNLSFAPKEKCESKSLFDAAREHFRQYLAKFTKDDKLTAPGFYQDLLNTIFEAWEKGDIQEVSVAQLKYKGKVRDIKGWLDILSRSGLILYYRDDPFLEDYVWLNPQAVIKNIYEFLRKDVITAKAGCLKEKDLKGLNNRLLKLLEHEKVIFLHNPTGNDKDAEFIVPNFLPTASKDDVEYSFMKFGMKPDFTMKFEHFIPFGLINQMICFFGKQPDKKMFWRDRLLFTLKNMAKVVIELDFDKMEITVFQVPLPEYNGLLNEIREYLFYSILDMYWGEQPEAWGEYWENKREKIKKKEGRWKKEHPPEDLYISLDGEFYVKALDLLSGNIENNRVNAYSLNNKNDETGEIEVKRLPIALFNAFGKEHKTMKKVFISYSHKDTEHRMNAQKFLVNLEREGLIETWHDGLIQPGTEWDKSIQESLENADIVILLVSQDFIASNYIHEVEMRKSLEKVMNKKEKCRIFPVLLSSCDWQNWRVYPKELDLDEAKKNEWKVANFQFLPKDNNNDLLKVNKMAHPEDAWLQLVDAIRKYIG